MLGSRVLAFLTTALLATTGCVASLEEPSEATEASESFLSQPVSYESVEGLTDSELKSGLYALIKNHRALGYDRARKHMFSMVGFFGPDGMVECQYSGRKVRPNGTATPGGFNTEHTWPQSMGADREPARSDLHHLFPVDSRTNSARGNYPFGTATCLHDETDCTFENGGSALGKSENGERVFEVRAQRRGDVARAMFYFSVRYNKRISLNEETTLRAWHEEDPVDADEVRRNDAIQAAQNNRNPFVDRPDFVARISDF